MRISLIVKQLGRTNPLPVALPDRSARICRAPRFLEERAAPRWQGEEKQNGFRVECADEGRQPVSSPAAPRDDRPDALVKVIPGNFGRDLEAGDRSGDFNPARHEPADREGIERSHGPPTDGFEDRPRMRLCSAKRTHP